MTETTGRAAPPEGSQAEGSLEDRAAVHAALGEPHRLAIVDALRLTDRSPTELVERTGLASNLLAFHLDALEEVGLITRRRSQGDARRRYATLRWEVLAGVELRPPRMAAGTLVFACTHNAARSQLAEAIWRRRAGGRVASAGRRPADEVHPLAVEVAAAHGLDLSGQRPRGYGQVEIEPDLVVSVCDRAWEAGLPWSGRRLHWSVPDPSEGDRDDFEAVFDDLERRIVHLAEATA